jgi:hypothetical protein
MYNLVVKLITPLEQVAGGHAVDQEDGIGKRLCWPTQSPHSQHPAAIPGIEEMTLTIPIDANILDELHTFTPFK